MRFLLFDRVTDLEPGKRIRGVKTVPLADDALNAHFERRPVYPGTLVIEAMLQLTGWAAITKHDYRYSVVLSVVEDVVVPSDLRPGATLEIEGELLGTNPKGSIAKARVVADGEEVASIGRILYAHIPFDDPEVLKTRFRYYGGPV